MKKNKKSFIATIVVVIVVCSVMLFVYAKFTTVSNSSPEIECYEIEGEYGYKIYINGEVFINQPFIPSVSGNPPFCSKADASSVATLVRNRLMLKRSYTVTKKDIEKLQISLYCL
ncbi:DUF4907 domain-containing protein [Neptunitalea chrysea]|uniref:DUF4907 domain-containing protein n=1 Tax=Neptunitalea chrysea TaxID=1647581 RepID=A0A9W6EU01_9FLAO|nr:DUF4907 domain-containing protein [Neptunitalea chrysea]GLB51096.1 DUF4907 domain-containing protein [Neptunitalea chrysea]